MENETPSPEVEKADVVEIHEMVDADFTAKPARKIKLKYIVIAAIVIVALGAVYYYKGLFFVASVNGQLISRLSVIKELERSSGKQALDYIVTDTLVNNELKKSGVTVSADDVNKAVDSIVANIQQQGSTLAATLALQ